MYCKPEYLYPMLVRIEVLIECPLQKAYRIEYFINEHLKPFLSGAQLLQAILEILSRI